MSAQLNKNSKSTSIEECFLLVYKGIFEISKFTWFYKQRQ